ncbi:MAG: radical SAM family heme chaperone HemW [Cyclobacteriaceae bacterium]
MAGIYIHIPFCRQACFYCDFHFSTNLSIIERMTNSIARESVIMSQYLPEKINTIYFGGGTPSLLPLSNLEILLNTIIKNYKIEVCPEITLEANPDDINQEKLFHWKELGINRLSIGIQSFNQRLLTFMNRVHTRNQAISCIEEAMKIGFTNMSIDLIFAIPGQSLQELEHDLDLITRFRPVHIATYNLTIEPKTVFGNWHNKGKLIEVDQDEAARQYEIIMDYLVSQGYEHYEISNFALPGLQSRHNSSYWQHKPYLGLGPGAHSFNGHQRHFNVSNNSLFMKGIESGNPARTIEYLSSLDLINEFILTGLRSNTGCNLSQLQLLHKFDLWQKEKEVLQNYLKSGHLEVINNKLILTKKGKFIADQITSDLFQV